MKVPILDMNTDQTTPIINYQRNIEVCVDRDYGSAQQKPFSLRNTIWYTDESVKQRKSRAGIHGIRLRLSTIILFVEHISGFR